MIELKAAGAIAGAGGAAVATGGHPIAGCIQYTEETDPDYFSAAVDIFVGTAAQGRGVVRTPCGHSSPGCSTCAGTTA